jgi:hypothetical protein
MKSVLKSKTEWVNLFAGLAGIALFFIPSLDMGSATALFMTVLAVANMALRLVTKDAVVLFPDSQ